MSFGRDSLTVTGVNYINPNPFDVDTLARTVQASEQIVGNEIDRLQAMPGMTRLS